MAEKKTYGYTGSDTREWNGILADEVIADKFVI